MSNITDTRRHRIAQSTAYTGHIAPWFGVIAFVLDFSIIVASAVATGATYHLAVYGQVGHIENYVFASLVVAICFVSLRYYDKRYAIDQIDVEKNRIRKILVMWNIAFMCLLVVGFLTKATDIHSRGTIVAFYVTGAIALIAVRVGLGAMVQRGYKKGWFAAKRVFLCGTRDRVDEFLRRYRPAGHGLTIVGEWHLPQNFESLIESDPDAVDDNMKQAAAYARKIEIDDIFVVAPWSSKILIERCTRTFLSIPASIHLSPEAHFDKFADLQISRIGTSAGLRLARAPLTRAEILAKRLFDVVIASMALIMLLPVLLLAAALTYLENGRPVLFLQRRHGFNEKEFAILKFRTMTCLDDGDTVQQATAGDPRVTRVGRVLRRWNFDELPQLVNVLKGDMSLVGPRPHALAHNRDFTTRVASYARRHNVKPGITGWAQINGLRGETDTAGKMAARVAHDLHYIDNWSIGFDIYILVMTVLSRKARRNAV